MSELIDVRIKVTLAELADLADHHAILQDIFEEQLDVIEKLFITTVIKKMDFTTLEMMYDYFNVIEETDIFIQRLAEAITQKFKEQLE